MNNKSKSFDDFVSVLIPAYNHSFFDKALISALEQTHDEIEIIVCDDSGSEHIFEILENYKTHKNFSKINYIKNPKNLGQVGNYIKLLNLSNGKYIKFLNDDDILNSTCIEKMISYFRIYQEKISLVTSRREIIDEFGKSTGVFRVPFEEESGKDFYYFDGIEMGNMALSNILNFIGEPSTTLFRKKDLENIFPNIFSLNGKLIFGNGDMTMWINLLTKGDAIFISEVLSFFRVHENQSQKENSTIYYCHNWWYQLINEGPKLGFLLDKSTKLKMICNVISLFLGNTRQSHFTTEQTEFFTSKIEELQELKYSEVKSFYLDGIKCLNEKDFSSAEIIFLKLLDYDSNNVDLLYNFGLVKYYLEKFPEAIEFFSLVIRNKGLSFNVCKYIAECLENIGESETAKIYFHKAKELKEKVV